MRSSAKEFGRLLTEAVQRIKSREGKKIGAIQDELGYAVGRTGATVEHWRKGNLPAQHEQTEALVKMLSKRTDLDRNWFRRLLTAAGYPGTMTLLDELRPKDVSETHADRRADEWPVIPPELPPTNMFFIGREKQLLTCRRQLDDTHVVPIVGMPGAGKTTLAAALLQWVNWPKDRLFWYTFRGEEGLTDIVWRLVDFLAWHGEPDMKRMLHGHTVPPAAVLWDSLLFALQGKGYLLCFDNLHVVDGKSFVEHLYASLTKYANLGLIDVLLISRTRLKTMDTIRENSLSGLTYQEVVTLLAHHGVSLADEEVANLYAMTQGNPQMLMLLVDVLKQGRQVESLIAPILRTSNIEGYILKEVDDELSQSQRSVMQAVAVLQGAAASRALLERMIHDENLWRVLNELLARHLLTVIQDQTETYYSQHATVQQFYYNQLTTQERRRLHQRAGDFFAGAQDRISAALHLELAGDYAQAAHILCADDTVALVRTGRVTSLAALLERLLSQPSVQSNPTALPPLHLLLGTVYHFLGQPREALRILGPTLLVIDDDSERARVLYALGRACDAAGDFAQALEYHRRSVDLYAALNSPEGLAQAWAGIAWAHYGRGTLQEAEQSFVEAQLLATRGGFQDVEAGVEMGLGVLQWQNGDADAAEIHFQRARSLFVQLHEPWNEGAVISNLGLIHAERGEIETARSYWEEALTTLEKLGRIYNVIMTLANLAESYFDTGEFVAARGYCEEALQIMQAVETMHITGYVRALYAETLLALGDIEMAQAEIQCAHQLAAEHNFLAELGVVYRVWGEIEMSQGNETSARRYFEEGRRLLLKNDSYRQLARFPVTASSD